MSNLPENVTQSDIDRYYGTEDISVDEFIESIRSYGDTSLASAPEAIQVMFRSWCEDDHYPLSLVNKDDHECLWDKFLVSLVAGKVSA